MVAGVKFNPQVDPRIGNLGAFTVNPTRVAQPQTTGNEYGIAIPQIHSYTNDGNGNKIALGQDGVGLAHRNPEEYGLHLIG